MRPFAKYRSNSGLIKLKIELVLLMMHFKMMPEGSFEILNTRLSVIVTERFLPYVETLTPFKFYIPYSSIYFLECAYLSLSDIY